MDGFPNVKIEAPYPPRHTGGTRYIVWKSGKPEFACILVASNSLQARQLAANVTPGASVTDMVAIRESMLWNVGPRVRQILLKAIAS